MRMKQIVLVTLGCFLLWTAAAAVASEKHEHSLMVGEKGEITLKKSTRIGNRELQPGIYVVQHRSSGGNHFVRFVELERVKHWDPGTQLTYTEADKAGEIKCRVEPAGAPSKETTVFMAPDAGLDRITKVVIKGEDVVHIF